MDENPVRRCGAMTRGIDRDLCRRACAPGFTRCNLHGGAAPAALREAGRMLAIARLPAARVPLQIIDDYFADACDACGRPESDALLALNAAKEVLNRTGLRAGIDVHNAGATPAAWTRRLTREEAVQAIISAAKQRMEAGAPQDWLLPPKALLPSATSNEERITEVEGANPRGLHCEGIIRSYDRKH
jgi:hypothetical protein